MLIFIVEDDVIYQEIVRNELEQKKFNNVEVFSSGVDCVNNLYKMPDIILVDYNLDNTMDGIQLLKKIKVFNPNIQVLMLSAQEKLDVAINSMKYGAYDYIIKNDVAMKRIGFMVDKINNLNQLLSENFQFKKNRNLLLASIGIIATICITLSLLFPRYF